MWIHYDTNEIALNHLKDNGWTLCKSGRWVSKDGTCAASVHPAHGEVVVICYTEVA